MLAKELVHAFVQFNYDVDTTNHSVDTVIGYYDYIKNPDNRNYIRNVSNHSIDATFFDDLSFERRTRRSIEYRGTGSGIGMSDIYLETTTEMFVFCRKAKRYLRTIQHIKEEFYYAMCNGEGHIIEEIEIYVPLEIEE